MVKIQFKSALIACAFAVLAGCASVPGTDGLLGRNAPDYTVGADLAAQFTARDQAALAGAFTTAMESGEMQRWRGGRAMGVVMPGRFAVGNLEADPGAVKVASRGDFDLTHVMETDLGPYVLTRNSNIRTGPGAENPIAEVLPSGSGVEAVGRVTDRNWMMIAVDGVVRGYVFGDLLIKAPGTELLLAGGPLRKPVLCRTFTQRAEAPTGREEWRGVACYDGALWRIVRPSPQDVDALRY